jgi:hypothetical protein
MTKAAHEMPAARLSFVLDESWLEEYSRAGSGVEETEEMDVELVELGWA